jgi:hypothetical protein
MCLRTCTCLEGWKGDGCEQPDCPDDCNFRGTCNTSLARPKCTGCDIGWMGKSCNEECNGIQDPMDSGIYDCYKTHQLQDRGDAYMCLPNRLHYIHMFRLHTFHCHHIRYHRWMDRCLLFQTMCPWNSTRRLLVCL